MRSQKSNRLPAGAAGFSLIELMVALTIGSVLIAGAVFVYSQSRNTYVLNESMARLQEEARYALSIIEPDLQLSGNYGYTNNYNKFQLLVAGALTPPLQLAQTSPAAPGLAGSVDDCGRNFAVDLIMSVQGSNNAFVLGPGANPVGPGSGCAVAVPLVGTPLTTPDTLTIRRASTNSVLAQANRLQLFTSRVRPSDQRIFVSGIEPFPIDLGMDEVRDLIVRTYYVARDSDGRPGFPALRVISLGAGQAFTDLELIPGVEDLQVQFGIDTGDYNNDGVIDDDLNNNGVPEANGIATRYVNPNDAILQPPPLGRSAQVVSVRLWLRLRAEQPEPGFVDNRPYVYAGTNHVLTAAEQSFRRVLVTRTIFLRNARTL